MMVPQSSFFKNVRVPLFVRPDNDCDNELNFMDVSVKPVLASWKVVAALRQIQLASLQVMSPELWPPWDSPQSSVFDPRSAILNVLLPLLRQAMSANFLTSYVFRAVITTRFAPIFCLHSWSRFLWRLNNPWQWMSLDKVLEGAFDTVAAFWVYTQQLLTRANKHGGWSTILLSKWTIPQAQQRRG